MDYREKAFKEKFGSAARHLGVNPNQIISLKFRETVSSYSEYHKLLDILQKEANISYQKLDGNFQGTGYLLNDANSKVILVEHETGLEVLYIAGSIASLIGLVHLIGQCWTGMRNHFGSHRHRDFLDIEVRALDEKGHIQEDRHYGHESMGIPFLPSRLIISAITNLENEVRCLRQEIKTLSGNIKKAEKPARRKTAIKKARNAKKRKVSK